MARCPTCHRRLRRGTLCTIHGTGADDGAPPPAIPTPPAELPVELGERIGAGGFAAVYTDAGDPTRVVKIAHRDDPQVAARFDREADALAAIGPPLVPRLYHRGRAGGRPYLVLERIAGRTLAELLEQVDDVLPVDDVVAIAGAVLRVLAGVHAVGWVHRDLKPENVFISADLARATLIDFGLVRDVAPAADDTALTATGAVLGTPEYMAPEQLAAAMVGTAADLYAAGVVLYELCTARVPFAGDVASIERGHLLLRPPLPSRVRPLPRALEDLVIDLLAKEPAARPAASAALDRLAAVTGAATAETRAAVTDLGRADEPTLIAVVDGGSAAQVAAIVARHRGAVVRQDGARVVCVIGGAADPAGAAVAIARELIAHGSRVALHIAPAQVRARAGRVRARGAAIDHPDTWLPPAWTGIAVTAACAPVVARRVSLEDAGGFFRAREGEHPSATQHTAAGRLIGRASELARLEAALDHATAAGEPTLALVVGEAGAGKSRLVRELADRAEARGVATAWLFGDDGDRAVAGDLLRATPTLAVIDGATSDVVLDAVELACAGHAPAPLMAVVAVDPGFAFARPRYGERARHLVTVELGPLPASDAAELARELLAPVEYPPVDVVDRITAWSGSMPGILCDVVRALRADGIVRKRAGASGWVIATGALDQLPASPAETWLAARLLSSLPGELADLARVAAVLGEEISATELSAVLDLIDREGGPGSPVDAGAGLRELAERGVVAVLGAGRMRFRGSIREALYAGVAAGDRELVHARATAAYRAMEPTPRVLDRVAHHAARSGAPAVAIAAELELAARALAGHRYVECDHRVTAALASMAPGDPARLQALRDRARVRYRIDRPHEALEDLDAALAVCDGAELEAELLLDRAIVLDWMDRFEEAAEHTVRAAALAPALGARLELARGRDRFRADQLEEAAACLAIAADDPAAGDETRIIARVMRAPTLVLLGEVEDARVEFDRALELCRAAGDRFHLATALANRVLLREEDSDLDGATADLAAALEIVRELGATAIEMGASHHLAELLFWRGDLAAAGPIAERAALLQERRVGRPGRADTLLLARIAADRGDRARAVELLASLPPVEDAVGTVVERAVRGFLGDAVDWDALVAEAARELPADESLEVRYWRVRAAPAAAAVDDARGAASGRPHWIARFAAITASRDTP